MIAETAAQIVLVAATISVVVSTATLACRVNREHRTAVTQIVASAGGTVLQAGKKNSAQIVSTPGGSVIQAGNVTIRASNNSVAAITIGAAGHLHTDRTQGALAAKPAEVQQFSAISECPGCGDLRTHYLRLADQDAPDQANVIRECVSCGHCWGQR